MAKLYIAMYHYVRDLENSRYPNIKGLDVRLFKQQIEYLKNNFTLITIEDIINYFDNWKKIPDNSALLTFDDGYIDHYTTVFPILQENGIQGSFFIPGKTFTENVLLDVNKIHFILASAPERELYNDVLSSIDQIDNLDSYGLPEKDELIKLYAKENRFDTAETIFVKRMLQTVLPECIRNTISSQLFDKYVGIDETVFAKELYMNIDQIKCMKRNGMYIGLHGYDHYWLANLSKEKMEEDIDKSLVALESVIDQSGFIMNYPYGNYNKNVLAYLRKKGCRLGMSTEVRVANPETDDRLTLPRLDCNDFPPKSTHYLEVAQ